MPSSPVLLVDDNAELRELLAHALRRAGESPVSAGNGLEAIAWLRSGAQRPKAVLLDLLMPGMDGVTFLDVIRRDPALHDLPVILFTAAGDAHVERAIRHGASGCLLKGETGLNEILAELRSAAADGPAHT